VMKFDDELKRALAPEDPGEAFTARVLEGVNGNATPAKAPAASLATAAAAAAAARWRMVLAIAASLLITIGGGIAWMRHVQYVQEGERARAQVLLALRLTSEKLNVVHAAVIGIEEPR
jgi:hypothetical protein